MEGDSRLCVIGNIEIFGTYEITEENNIRFRGTSLYFAKSHSFVLVISSRSMYRSGRSTSSYSLSGSGSDTCEGSPTTRTGPATRSTSSPTS